MAGDLKVPHRAFMLYPGSDRSLLPSLITPVSEWAMDAIMATLDERSADAAYDLYMSIQGSSPAAAFRGKLWERRVHRFFRSLPTPWAFTIRSLNNSLTRQFGPFYDMEYFNFGSNQMLPGYLMGCVDNCKPGYFQRVAGNFPTLDCIVYQPDNNPLVGIQVTDTSVHSLKAKGLEDLQMLLNRKTSLAHLRPSTNTAWILLFVVPSPT
jgi:hypothetical protein